MNEYWTIVFVHWKQCPATFVLHHPEHGHAVILPIISCIIDGTMAYCKDGSPFSSFISLFCPDTEVSLIEIFLFYLLFWAWISCLTYIVISSMIILNSGLWHVVRFWEFWLIIIVPYIRRNNRVLKEKEVVVTIIRQPVTRIMYHPARCLWIRIGSR